MVGTNAKESSVEIGAIVPGGAGLRGGGTGMSEDEFEMTINPREDHSSPGAVLEAVVVCAVVGVLEAYAEA